MSSLVSKSALRQDILRKRKTLSAEQQAENAYLLKRRFIENFAYFAPFLQQNAQPNNKNIGAYWAIKSEINPQGLMQYLENLGFELTLPAVISEKDLLFCAFCYKNFFEGKIKLITEPIGTKTLKPNFNGHYEKREPNFFLVPLVAFDNFGNRIGYGKGYYDHYLAKQKEQKREIFTLGLAHAMQEVEKIPSEPFDQKLNAVLTEKGLHIFS